LANRQVTTIGFSDDEIGVGDCYYCKSWFL